MKRLWRPLVAMILLTSTVPPSAHARDGRALLPSWFKDGSPNSTSVFMSNISNEVVTVHIQLFRENGELYDESSEAGTNFLALRGLDGDPLSPAGATLAPDATGELRIVGTGPTETGYGVIEWASAGKSKFALVAYARQTFEAPSGIALIPINDFQPF